MKKLNILLFVTTILSSISLTKAQDVTCYDEITDFYSCSAKLKKMQKDGEFGKLQQALDSLNQEVGEKIYFGANLSFPTVLQELQLNSLNPKDAQRHKEDIEKYKSFLNSSSFLKEHFSKEISNLQSQLDATHIITYGQKSELKNILTQIDGYSPEIRNALHHQFLTRIVHDKDQELVREYVKEINEPSFLHYFIQGELGHGNIENLLFLQKEGVNLVYNSDVLPPLFCTYLNEIIETQEDSPTMDQINNYISNIIKLTTNNERENLECEGASLNIFIDFFKKTMIDMIDEDDFSPDTSRETIWGKTEQLKLSSDDLVVHKNNQYLHITRYIDKKCNKQLAQEYINTWGYNYAQRIFKKSVNPNAVYQYVESFDQCLVRLDYKWVTKPQNIKVKTLDELFNLGWQL